MRRTILNTCPEVLHYTGIWTDTLRGGATQLVNTNKLLRRYNGITGLKTGTTGGAGVCISASASRDGLRLVAVEQGRVIAAAKSGKVKTACTMVGIILMLIFPNAPLRLVCVAVILVTTIYSGIEYFVKN